MKGLARRKWFRLMLVAVALGVAALGVLVGSGLDDRVGHADLALVLGNQVTPDGRPSPRLKARLDRAKELYDEGWYPRILVSGGTGREGYPEGTAMKDYLISAGVPEKVILVDNDGVDTMASARNATRVLREHGLQSVFVVTQYYHVPRSRLALSKCGVESVFSAHARYFEFRDVYSTLRELPAWLKYLLVRADDGHGG